MLNGNKKKKINPTNGEEIDLSYGANGVLTDKPLQPINNTGNLEVDTSYGANPGGISMPSAPETPITPQGNDLLYLNGIAPSTTFGAPTDISYGRKKFSAEVDAGGTESPSTTTSGATGGNSDTGSTDTGSTDTGSTPSYLEYYQDTLPAELERIYNDTIAQITASNELIVAEINKNKEDDLTYAKNAKTDAYGNAMTTEHGAIIDADNSYERNKASYGAQAEALADMGLSGGGYSQYLDSQAYAANRADKQAAAAQRVASERAADKTYDDLSYKINADADKLVFDANQAAADAKNTAKTTYEKDLLAAEDKALTYKQNMFDKILEGFETGVYSSDKIESLANLYEFSPEQKALLETTAKSYVTAEAEAEADDFIKDISSGYDVSTENIEKLYNKGKGSLPETKYKEAKAAWLNNMDTSEDAFNDPTGNLLSKKDAEDILNHPWLEGTTKKAELQKIFDKLYTAKTYDFGTAYSDDEDVEELSDVGNNFDIVFDGEEYDVESAGEIKDDKHILELGKNVKENQIFGYDGRLFVKKEGRVFEIRGRGNELTTDWAKLTNLFFNTTQHAT